MTEAAGNDPVLTRLDQLLDLFQRRLLEDKTARQALGELTERARRAEAGLFREALQPMVVHLARTIDRLDCYAGPDAEFAASIREELLEVLAAHGVEQIDTEGSFDPGRHEAIEVNSEAELPDREVTAVLRRGYRYGDWVFRPAQVSVNRLRR